MDYFESLEDRYSESDRTITRRYSRLFSRESPLGIAAPGGLPVGLGAGLAPRLAGNRRLATVLALAKQPGSLSLFLSVAPPVLPALRGPVPGPFV